MKMKKLPDAGDKPLQVYSSVNEWRFLTLQSGL